MSLSPILRDENQVIYYGKLVPPGNQGIVKMGANESGTTGN